MYGCLNFGSLIRVSGPITATGLVPGATLRFGSQCLMRLPLSASGSAAITFGPPSTAANTPEALR